MVRVTVADCVVPVVTLPNASLLGFTESVPTVTPVPASGILREGFEAFEVTVTAPLAFPAAVGLKVIEREAVCPAARVRGVVIPLTLNAPLTAICEIVIEVPPVFVRVSVKVELAAMTTLPKLKLAGVAVNAPGVTPVPDNDIVRVGFDAFDVIVTVPLAAPAA